MLNFKAGWLQEQNNHTRCHPCKLRMGNQNYMITDWKNVAWSDGSRLQLQHSDVGPEFGMNKKAVIPLAKLQITC